MSLRLKQKKAAPPLERSKIIVRTSVIGILANLLLAAVKAAVGAFSRSIAVVLDAVNNLSDAASSVITIVGARLAGKEPDKKHPFGHGRIEYLSAMIIAVIILYAGLTSLVEAVKKILWPPTPDYSAVSLLLMAAAVAVKLILGQYVKARGRETHSDALVNSGQDAALDAVITASTLAAAVIFMSTGLSLEAYLGAVISLVIIKSGLSMLWETLSKILGERADLTLARDIKHTIGAFPNVLGVYDLVLNNYGPDAFNGSVHIEVPDTCSASALDEMIREITAEVYRQHRVILTAVGVYSVNTQDEEIVEMRQRVHETVFARAYVLQMHGFYVNKEKKIMRFDLVISFDAPDRHQVFRQAISDVQALYPEYHLEAAMDTDFSETE